MRMQSTPALAAEHGEREHRVAVEDLQRAKDPELHRVTPLEPGAALLSHVTRHERDLQMTAFLDTENRLEQFDRELGDLTRGHGHVLDLAAFRSDVDTAHLPPSLQPSDPAETPSAPPAW